MPRFLHAADLHLDSPLRGLERYPGAPVEEIRNAARRGLENLVREAIERSVDFVLLAGDIYDGDWPDYHTGLFFVQQMQLLREAAIPVLAIRGNHDAANKMTKSLPLPDNVRMLSHQQPETVLLEDLGVAVHGRGFAQRAELENMAVSYPAATAGMFNIGLLHTSLAGAEGHEPYAPCSLEDLRAKNYQYWALGHIHQREVVHQRPWVVFPGNLQGRHIRESGAKGAYLVEAEMSGELTLEFLPLDVFRWGRLTLEVDQCRTPEDVLETFASQLSEWAARENRPLAIRVTAEGACPAHAALTASPETWMQKLRAETLQISDAVWLEKIQWRTRPPVEQTPIDEGPLREIALYLQELQEDAAVLALANELKELQNRLPEDVFQEDALPLDDPQYLRRLLEETEPLLAARLADS